MDAFMESLVNRDIIAWGIVAVVLIIGLKLMKAAGKGFLIFLCVIGIIVLVGKFFPGVMQPFVDFVGGGWLGSGNPNK